MGSMNLELEGEHKKGFPNRFEYYDKWLLDLGVEDPVARAIMANRYCDLEIQADHDNLTGLYNERGFDKYVKSSTNIVYLLYIDIDDFGPINKNWGHQAGDDLLKFVSKALENAIEGFGVAGRLHGDEFALAVTTKDPQIIEMIKTKCQEPLDKYPPPITLSMAGSAWDGKENLAYVKERADLKMLNNKEDRKRQQQNEQAKYGY